MKNLSRGFKSIFCLASLFFSLSSYSDVINGGFEIPALGAGNFQYQPSGGTWLFTGAAGISNINSGFTSGAPEVPGGQQVGFLQGTGSMQQNVYLVPGSVLSFHATQRVNYGTIQSIQVLVNSSPLYFHLGATQGSAISTTTITPPKNYYETYAVKLGIVRAGYYTLAMRGTNSTTDSTVFIDSIAISTPTNHAYGFWDQSIVNGAWRSDYASSTVSPAYGPCIFTYWNYTYTNSQVEKNSIIGAGATPYGSAGYGYSPYQHSPCWGVDSGRQYPQFTQANWTYSTNYTFGNPHWIVDVNYEFVASTQFGCPAFGPPNQSRAIVAPGNLGPSISVNATTSQSDPAIGNYNVVSLISNDTNGDNASGCMPYVAFGASTVHGNVKPIAIMDSAGYYRPHLKFRESVFQDDGQSYTYGWLVFSLSGWNDNYKRMISIALGAQGKAPTDPSGIDLDAWWNWNVENSYYYPGGVFRFTSFSELNTKCGLALPQLSFTNTYIGSGHSPSSISTYDIDLYSVVHCVAGLVESDGASAWLNPSGANQLPDPITVTQLNWALEGVAPMQNWIAIWNPIIQ